MTVLYNIKELKLGGKSAKSIRTNPIPANSWLSPVTERNNWKSDELVTMAALKNLIITGVRSVDYQYGDMIQYGTYYYDTLTLSELHYGILLTSDTTLAFKSETTNNLSPRDELFITNNFTGVQDSNISSFEITEHTFVFKPEMSETTLKTIIVSEAIDVNKISDNNDGVEWIYKIEGDNVNFNYASDLNIILPENSTIDKDTSSVYVLDTNTSPESHSYTTVTNDVETKWIRHFNVTTTNTQITCTFNKNEKWKIDDETTHNVQTSWVDSIPNIAPNGAYVIKYIQ